jgi:hypothetical protein
VSLRCVPDRLFIADGDDPASEVDPAPAFPTLEILVHDLPRDAEKAGEIFL